MSATTTTASRASSSSFSSSSSSGGGRQQQGPRGTTGFPHIQHTRTQRPNDHPGGHHQPHQQQNARPKGGSNSKGGNGSGAEVAPPAISAAKDLVGEVKATSAASPAAVTHTMSSSGQLCIVCCDPIEYCSLGTCNHHEVCHVCSLRMRALYKNNACSFCKADLATVVFTKDQGIRYDDVNLKSCFYDDQLGIFHADREILERCRHLLKANCPLKECGRSLNNLNDLKRHVSRDHPGLVLW